LLERIDVLRQSEDVVGASLEVEVVNSWSTGRTRAVTRVKDEFLVTRDLIENADPFATTLLGLSAVLLAVPALRLVDDQAVDGVG